MRIEIGEEEMNCEEDEAAKEKPVADVVEPVQAPADANQKKSTKKLVSRTYVNDEGFMGKQSLFKVPLSCLLFLQMENNHGKFLQLHA